MHILVHKYSPTDAFCITENNHGFEEKVGFLKEKIWELFGNVNYFQCEHGNIAANTCISSYFPLIYSKDFKIKKDEFNNVLPFPKQDAPLCQCKGKMPGKVRPNVLLYNDTQ